MGKKTTDKALEIFAEVKNIFPDISDKLNEFPIVIWEDEKYIHIDIEKKNDKT